MSEPTIREAVAHLADHYGIPFTRVLEIIRVPLHPATLRDGFAMAMLPECYARIQRESGRIGSINWQEEAVEEAYSIADIAMKVRTE